MTNGLGLFASMRPDSWSSFEAGRLWLLAHMSLEVRDDRHYADALVVTTRSLGTVFAVTLGVLTAPVLASAWDAAGHRTVAAIAWEHMTPRARARAVDLLMHGPGPAQLASLRPPHGTEAERDRALIMNAATWPDLVRSPNEPWSVYNRPTWHYADFYWDVEYGKPHDLAGTGPDSVNAIERIVALRAALANPDVPDTTKAVDLAWLLHLVGDIHQPLHGSSRVTAIERLPRGDRGGNTFTLADNRPLHLYWDGILGEAIAPDALEDSIAYATRITARIEQLHPLASLSTETAVTDVARWAHESLQLAQTVVYDDLERGVAPPPAYRAEALSVSEKRMALAGYRLATLLNEALK